MPKVGKRHFAYTKKGVSAAKSLAKKKGLPLKVGKKKGKMSEGGKMYA